MLVYNNLYHLLLNQNPPEQAFFPHCLKERKKMAPSGRTTTASTRTTSKTTRRTRQQRRTTNFKKKQQQQHNTKSNNNKKQQEEVPVPTVLPSSYCSSSSISSQDSSNSKEVDNMHGSAEVIDVCNSPCSTPKGKKFRIPEISTCPPAPKKPRVLSNCSLRRSPLSFFAPPDLEHFFFVALRDVSV
ncbi:hypothetical protein AAZX31_08G325000 [Glycine max]|uniref:Cyclin-dependent protein kinase inhibitor SMR13 n=3 Tax=Glycine subgen. Soja TaxID=1462606 RepID=C6T822_SOYBN|nr:uncharacterized protein LOC100785545 [Glycine max]XP_028246202.1 uncharacterized protein LOC114423585 [Glycine soja]ACU17974.1 unknown [Glycine max]KAG5002158.1 hypothetical protein JHK87_023230 [Glycine soja]KAG5027437.1 hypothetical protein JHK86_023351 [Glycine max]KAG5138560.1 hypothetical protein JHK82_023291 [Glycine max]KAH1054365.1 hypothetical protein GYH30_023236 [Glycine max]|eukprot:NP_001240966.1 uncharacterized protein LOC100785545 [Glycine max]